MARVATKLDNDRYLIEEDGKRVGTATSPAEAFSKNVEAIARTVKLSRLLALLRDTTCKCCGEEMIPQYEEIRQMNCKETDIYLALSPEGETEDLICPACIGVTN